MTPRQQAVAIAALLWIVSLIVVGVGVGYWQHEAGATAERVTWQARENKQIAEAGARILMREEQIRAAERKSAQELVADIAAQYEKEKADVAATKDRIIAGLRSGSVRLRIPIAATVCPDRSDAGPPAAGAGERDGRATGELPVQISEDLVSLVSEADEVVKQLAKCQTIVRKDREFCGQASPD